MNSLRRVQEEVTALIADHRQLQQRVRELEAENAALRKQIPAATLGGAIPSGNGDDMHGGGE